MAWDPPSQGTPSDLPIPLVVGLLLAATCAAPAMAQPADPRLAAYQRMLEWRYSSEAAALPDDGIVLEIDDVATLALERGVFRLAEPVEGLPAGGLVFEGAGRLVVEVPDPVELRQLRRFAEDPQLQRIDQPFTRLVLRTSEPALLDALPPAAPPFEKNALAADRHDHWLRIQRLDADARLVAAAGAAGDRFVRADVETRDHGWMSLTYDAGWREEIELARFHPRHDLLESWLSLDRSEDRTAEGRPGPPPAVLVDIDHVTITADLTEPSREPLRGLSQTQPVDASITARLDLEILGGPVTSLQSYLHPLAEVTAVRLADGRAVPFLRDNIGARTSALDQEVHDDSLVVLLPEPLSGRVEGLEIDYDLRLDGFARGRSWYPGFVSGARLLADLHTARFVLTTRDEYAVRAMGDLLEERQENRRRISTWEVERPVKMVTLTMARRHHEAVVELPGAPIVATFSSLGGYVDEERVQSVAEDVARAIVYFQELFASPLDIQRVQAALIPSNHGQAFDGFLQIGDFSTGIATVSAGELFRAHEVAHQWWGHKVGWVGYRDQWLSEALAEYSAMMFVQSTLEDGPKYFAQMLEAFGDEVQGSLKSAFSQFSRPGASALNRRGADRVGPIGHGFRCTVGEAPTAYLSQVYTKGALVLHMLRVLTTQMTGSQDAFVEVLRTFARRFDGGFATTEDFQAVVAEVVPADWGWFFDQWLLGAEIPTYRWQHEIARGGASPFELRLTIERHGVGDGFRMGLPVEVTLADGRTATVLAVVDEPLVELAFPLSERPKKVELNPDHAVLATVKKR